MLTTLLTNVTDARRSMSEIPGVVYMVGASFEIPDVSWHAEGPRFCQWLSQWMAQDGNILVVDGQSGYNIKAFTPGTLLDCPGGNCPKDFEDCIDFQLRARTVQLATNEKVDAAILGMSGQNLADCITGQTGFTVLNYAVNNIVPKLKQMSDYVVTFDYPGYGDRNIPWLIEVVNLDVNYLDNVWRPKYVADMTAAGVHVLSVYNDWQPTNKPNPALGTTPQYPNGYPDWHITSETSRRAAKRTYNWLMANTPLATR